MSRDVVEFTPEQAEAMKGKLLSRSRYNEDGCLEWIRGKMSKGYGSVRFGHAEGGPGFNMTTHRAMWTVANGPLPEDVYIDHICGNRACLEPSHLRASTPSENNRYRVNMEPRNTSGYRNVTWDKEKGKWAVRLTRTVNGKNKTVYMKRFTNIEDANRAAIAARAEHYGVGEHENWKEYLNDSAGSAD